MALFADPTKRFPAFDIKNKSLLIGSSLVYILTSDIFLMTYDGVGPVPTKHSLAVVVLIFALIFYPRVRAIAPSSAVS